MLWTLNLTCFTAAIPSANVHSVCEGVHPIVSVFLDRLKQVGQIRSVLNLSQKLIKLGMFVWKINKKNIFYFLRPAYWLAGYTYFFGHFRSKINLCSFNIWILGWVFKLKYFKNCNTSLIILKIKPVLERY